MFVTPESIAAEGSVPSAQIVGGKGSGLYWLAVNGFHAPATWVLTVAAFDLMIEQNGLAEAVREIDQATASSKDWSFMLRMLDQLEPQLQTVTRALHQSALPSAVHASLLQLPPHAQWAVRSSATVEDSGAHSFAGQFVSMLSVPAAASNLERAVREVWGSTFKRGVLTYRASLTAELPRMAVIFQPMQPITARERSGVILSRSPVPTMPGVLIQAMFGSGRGVVEGRGGDMYVVSGQEVCVRSLPPSNIKISGATGGEVTAPTPPGLALTTAEARLLATRVSEMADRWGKPVNVEFAWYAQEPEPLFVQIRPITGII